MFLVKKDSFIEDIKKVNELWKVYDINVNEIRNNLYDILDFSNTDVVCGKLKGVQITEESYASALNNLACSINIYYYDLIEFNENFSNYLDDYRDVLKVSKTDITDLRNKLKKDDEFYIRLKNMTLYKYDDESKIDILLEKTNYFLENYKLDFYDRKDLTYEELFIHKITELVYISNLSSWLKDEYYTL